MLTHAIKLGKTPRVDDTCALSTLLSIEQNWSTYLSVLCISFELRFSDKDFFIHNTIVYCHKEIHMETHTCGMQMQYAAHAQQRTKPR